jgi:probable F420-dependent oxidoreductase
VDGLWSYETAHDPFLPLFAAALTTERVQLGSAIAVAFARSPFAMAQTAWDLQRVSGGRLLLGLGTQVKAHVERRFSAAFDHPAARITDYIRCLRAIWDTFQNGTRPAYEGPFYRFTLISDFFNPGPIAESRKKSALLVAAKFL